MAHWDNHHRVCDNSAHLLGESHLVVRAEYCLRTVEACLAGSRPLGTAACLGQPAFSTQAQLTGLFSPYTMALMGFLKLEGKKVRITKLNPCQEALNFIMSSSA